MSRSEKLLKFLLRFNGVLAAMAVAAVVMPHSWLLWCVAHVEPDLNVGFLVSYLARTLSLYFVLIGLLLWIFAGDVHRYRAPITCVAVWALFAIFFFGIYASAHLPYLRKQWFFWFVVGDAAYSLLLVSAILVLQSRIRDPQALNGHCA